MSFDLTFVTRDHVAPQAVVQAVRRWADRNPHLKLDADQGGGQISYHNPDTLVHALFNLDFERIEDGSEIPGEFIDTGCTANFNYLRPAFFSRELTPLAVSLAEALSAHVFDPQDATILEAGAFATADSYKRHLEKINRRYLLSEDAAQRPRCVSGALLDSFWQHNAGKEALQKTLRDQIFVPTMLLMEQEGQTNPTTMFIWARAIPTAFSEAGLVLLSRERKSWFGAPKHEDRLAPFETFRRALSGLTAPLDGAPNHTLLQGATKDLEAAFDRLFELLPPISDWKSHLPSRITDLMAIVDAD